MSIRINVGAKFDAKDLQRARRELDALAKQSQTASGQMLRLGESMKRVGGQMTSAGRTMTRRITAPIAAIGGLAIKSAMDFETSFAKIEGLVGVSAGEIGALQDAARRLGPSLGVSANEAAEALFFITSAGLRGSEAIEALEMSLKASAIGLGDTATVADLVTSAVNAFGSATLSASKATDVLTMAVRLGKLAPEELAGSIGMVLPIASAMGVTFNDVGAAFAAMSRTGTNAATAGTQLRQILSALLKPTAQANEELEKYGLSAAGLRQQLREKGLLSVLETLTGTLGENEDSIAKVFGNVRALSGVVDLMGSNVAATRDVFSGMNDVLGVTNDALAVSSETAAFQFRVALEELKATLLGVGQELMPFARDAVAALSRVVERFNEMSDAQQMNILKAAGLAAIIGPLLIVLGQLVIVLGAVATAVGVIGVAAAGLGVLAAALGLAFFLTRDLNHELSKTPSLARGGMEGFELDNLQDAFDPDGASGRAAPRGGRTRAAGAGVAARAAREQAKALQEVADALTVETAAQEGSTEAKGAAGPKVVALTKDMRELLQSLNETHVGTGDAGDSIAQFSRELLAAGKITDQTAQAASRLAQVVRQDIDKALAKGNQRLDEARQKFNEYRDAIAGGIRRGNTLADAVTEQTSALEALTRAEEEYERAVASDDVERIEEADAALRAARKGQTTFLSFLQTGADTAEAFAAQIESLRLAGASMDVVRQIAELGARTGGRVIAELMEGGAEAIAQANRLVAAVEAVSLTAGHAAAEQFHGAGVRAAKAFVRAIEATIPELQSVLDRIADMIEKALGVRPDMDITGTRRFIDPPTPGSDDRAPALTPGEIAFMGGAENIRKMQALKLSDFDNFSIPGLAKGGLVTGPTLAMVGEAGPEAVIPLDRAGSFGTTININVQGAIDPEATARQIRRILQDAERRSGVRALT